MFGHGKKHGGYVSAVTGPIGHGHRIQAKESKRNVKRMLDTLGIDTV